MSWSRRYTIWSYFRSSHWIVPLVALVLEQITLRATLDFGSSVPWVPRWPFGLAGTQTAMQTIIALTTSFLVFTFGSMLVAIQVAGGQLTPRIISTILLRDNAIRLIAGLFIFSLIFTIGVISRIETEVPQLAVWVAAALGVGSLVAFLFLIDYAARFLRPVSIFAKVANTGFKVIDAVYPDPASEPNEAAPAPLDLGQPVRVVNHSGRSAVVVAADIEGLVSEARRVDGVIVFLAQIGDFVASGRPLFRLYGGAGAISDQKLRGSIAFGLERTIEQDSTFAFRVIVDIAIKALSRAINDPTTAVLAMDQLQRLLRRAGERHLRNEQIFDGDGQLRLIFPTPDWVDFVRLSCREIRLCGADSLQIARRLRAMIESLVDTLPEFRKPALRSELDLLDRSIDDHFQLPEDRQLARVPDTQGLGGASVARS